MNIDDRPGIDACPTVGNDDDENVILDLQMTIAAMQTEQEVAMKSKEVESQNQIRSLQEQLRRLQNETNVLRSRQHQQPKKQQPPQSLFTNFEKSLPPRHDTSNQLIDGMDSLIKILPPLTPPLTNSNNVSTHDDTCLQLPYDPLIQSPGKRLIHSLLLFHQRHNRSAEPALEQEIIRVLARMLSPSSSTSTSELLEWDVIQWFILEVMHVVSFAFTTVPVPSGSSIPESTSNAFTTNEMLLSLSSALFSNQKQLARVKVLLQWMYDALSLSPSSCIFFRRCATDTNSRNDISSGDKKLFVRRSNTITGCRASNRPLSEPCQQGQQQELRRIEQILSHPLIVNAVLPIHAMNTERTVDCETEEEPSYVQCCLIQRLMGFLQTWCTLSSVVEVSSSDSPGAEGYFLEYRNQYIDLSIQTIQFVTLVMLPGVHGPKDDCFFWDGNTLDTILTNVICMGTALLGHVGGSSSERRMSNDFLSGPPRRLAYIEYRQHQKKGSYALNENDFTLLEEGIVSSYMLWIVEAIQFLYLVIWNKSISIVFSSDFQQMWIDTKKTASFVSMLLDLLQFVILPDEQHYNHPLASATIAFFHNLIRPKRIEAREMDRSENESAEDKQDYFYWSLLLCHHVTDQSTEELWKTGPTATDLLVQLLYRIVVRQLVDDHLPNASSNTLLVISLLPIRDQIIRFIHKVLLYTQNDRRWLDTEQFNKNEPCLESKRKKPLSFTTILSDNVELFKSAAGSILSIPSNDDCIHYCFPQPDIRLMLKLQINELMEDAMEELQS